MTAIDWNKEFSITSVTRADLVSAGFSHELVASLSDEDMRTIAAKMEDMYCDHGYWDDVVTALEYVRERKRKE